MYLLGLIDAQNRRVGRAVNGVATHHWIYDSQLRVVGEMDGSGQHVSEFIYGSSQTPDVMIKNGVVYRIVQDHLGSPRLIVNSQSGSVLQRIDYDEFGRVLLDSNPGFQPFGFAGGLYDSETGLVRFGARDYDAEVGRWTAKDPILFGGLDTNLYGYVANDPVNWVDAEGLTKNRPGQVVNNDPLAGGGGGPPASAPVGRIGSMDMTAKGANCPTNISGRNYSGHALDRMQGRGITPSIVENTIVNGVSSMQSGGAIKLFDINNNVSVIINSNGNVIIVFPGK